MQLLKVWSVILVATRICAAGSIPAPDPNQPKVDKIILPFALTEVEGVSWECYKCLGRCDLVLAICGAVCVLPEPEMPFLCGACLAAAGAKRVCIECIRKCFKGGKEALDCYTAEYLKCTGKDGTSGICTVHGFARRVDNSGGQCKGRSPDCDVSVKPVKGCQ